MPPHIYIYIYITEIVEEASAALASDVWQRPKTDRTSPTEHFIFVRRDDVEADICQSAYVQYSQDEIQAPVWDEEFESDDDFSLGRERMPA